MSPFSYEREGWLGSRDLDFFNQDLKTGLKFLIQTQREIVPGNRVHLKRPVNLIRIGQLRNVYESWSRTIT